MGEELHGVEKVRQHVSVTVPSDVLRPSPDGDMEGRIHREVLQERQHVTGRQPACSNVMYIDLVVPTQVRGYSPAMLVYQLSELEASPNSSSASSHASKILALTWGGKSAMLSLKGFFTSAAATSI